MARPNAPTYPDADQRAPSTPITKVMPAAFDDASWVSTGPMKAPVVGEAAVSVFVSCDASVLPAPNSPRIDTIASSAGNSASTE